MSNPGRLPRPLFAQPRCLGLVAAGGAAGSTVRWALGTLAPTQPGGWPWATFGINVTGSFALGALLTWLAHRGPDDGWRRAVRLGVGTGVIGGYTTYSTFVVEVDRLIGDGHPGLGAGYALASVVLGVTAAALGVLTVRRAVR